MLIELCSGGHPGPAVQVRQAQQPAGRLPERAAATGEDQNNLHIYFYSPTLS